jgi:RNA polymerase sigma-70 factor (ECF subfamily)
MTRAHDEFARVYEDHVWRVYGYVAYRVGDRETAEDLTQATFERALRAWSRFDPRRGSQATWLLTIAHNLIVDHRRRDRSRLFELIDDRVLPSVPGPEERFSTEPRLASALAELGDREREVIALRYGGEMTGAEVAQLLGTSVANVQQVCSRSLRKLRKALEAPLQTGTPV